MNEDNWLSGLLLLAFIFANSWVAYYIGKHSTISKIEDIIIEQESVSTDKISLEDIKYELSKLR